MTAAYLDSSVVLRKLQREAGSLAGWGQWEHAYTSELLRVEVVRTINRTRLRGALNDRQVADLAERAHAVFDAVEFVALGRAVLNRAAQSFLTPLGTLDALHLATALRLAERRGIDLVFLTHDAELAIAARSVNFTVAGA
jgi:predicted nucleic acid-binding protein